MVDLTQGLQSFDLGAQIGGRLNELFTRDSRKKELNDFLTNLGNRMPSQQDYITLMGMAGPEMAAGILAYQVGRAELQGEEEALFADQWRNNSSIARSLVSSLRGVSVEDRMDTLSDLVEPYMGDERAMAAIKPVIQMFANGDLSDNKLNILDTMFSSTDRLDEMWQAGVDEDTREDEQAHDLAKIQADARAAVQTARDKDTYAKEMAQENGGSWQDWRVFLFNMRELEANEGDLTGMGGGGAFINPATGRPLDLGSYTGGDRPGIGDGNDPLAPFE